MGYQTGWYIENRIIFTQYGEKITLEEMQNVNDDVQKLLDEGNAPVHIIFDVSQLKEFPIDLSKARETLAHFSHPKMGWLIGYGMNPVMKFLSTVIANMFGVQLKSVNSFDEALSLLKRIDFSLEKET